LKTKQKKWGEVSFKCRKKEKEKKRSETCKEKRNEGEKTK